MTLHQHITLFSYILFSLYILFFVVISLTLGIVICIENLPFYINFYIN